MTKKVDWNTQLLGEISDTDLARQLGVDRSAATAARKVRGIARFDPGYVDWDYQPLGEVHDAELARRLGVSESAVNNARYRRGIAAKVRERVWDLKRGQCRRWVKWGEYQLGEKSDIEIAVQAGVNRSSVSKARRERGLTIHTWRVRCPCGEKFTARKRSEKYCSNGCQAAVCQHRHKHRARGERLNEVVASLARLRREVAKRREAKSEVL